MNALTKISFAAILLISLLSSCYYDNKEDLYQYVDTSCEFTAVSYQTDILASMQTHCLGCHNTNDPQGNVNLEGHANMLIYANNGSLYGSTAHTGGFSAMPPTGQKIPQCDIDKLKVWVDAGAPNN